MREASREGGALGHRILGRMTPELRALAVALVVSAVATTAVADAWRPVPQAARFARRGAPHVTLDAHATVGGLCGGGGCTQGIEVRDVHGTLPAQSMSYFYSDRPGASPGCYGASFDSLLSNWREIEIAPIAGSEADRPSCGISMMVGTTMQYWVILRVRD